MALITKDSGIKLASGQIMPYVGLGTWKIGKDIVAKTVEDAIVLGYRHIDCACDYGNEKEVGQGIAAALAKGWYIFKNTVFKFFYVHIYIYIFIYNQLLYIYI